MRRRLLTLAALIMPTLLLAGWAGYLAVARGSQPTLRIAIAGFDPRDLVRGHYLQFRLDLPNLDSLDCACLQPNPADAERPTAARCEAAVGCPHVIDNPRQVFRYYTTKERALALQRDLMRRPGGASVLVHFHGGGAVSFSDVQTR